MRTGEVDSPVSYFSKVWTALLLVVLIWLGAALSAHVSRPWITALGYNGAVWSQAAHNVLRAGLVETSGASSGFYFGPLPIPPSGYYLHHPPLLHLILAGLFAVFGEHEWVARMVPIACSVASAVLLWLLVRSCAGERAATLSAAIFACLPMELRYGKMVNFEPVVLMLMLGALWSIRNWKLSSDVRWKAASIGFVVVGLWVDWAMYLFVVALWICSLRRRDTRDRRFVTILFVATLLSALFYLLRIRLLRPDAWTNLAHTFFYRVGCDGGSHFTELDWIRRTTSSLTIHFLPIGCLLAMIGLAIIICPRKQNEGLRWLGWACGTISVMDVIFLVVFQNDSYIHQYIGFYFLAPIAALAGVALDQLVTRAGNIFRTQASYSIATCTACLLLVALGVQGAERAKALERQFQILDDKSQEPFNLIPELGAAIQENFSQDTPVLCNFLPDYAPQLQYYAQRDLLNNLSDYKSWHRYLRGAPKRIGGVVWMGSRTASDILAKLPAGTKRFVKFGEISFCLWKLGTNGQPIIAAKQSPQ
jgi:hypothetical protein